MSAEQLKKFHILFQKWKEASSKGSLECGIP